MKKIAWLVFLLNPVGAFATEIPKYEFNLRPSAGYSNYSGLLLGADVRVGVRLSDHWQWSLGGEYKFRAKRDDRGSLITGPRYNFNEDFSRSWFAGLYVEYGNPYFLSDLSGIFEVGRRFRMNDSGTWTYQPTLTIQADDQRAYGTINLLSFAYSF